MAAGPSVREADRTEVPVAPTAEVMRNVKETLRDAMLNGTPASGKLCSKNWWSR